MYTVDTNILIYHANGEAPVVGFLLSQIEKNIPLFLPAIVAVEFFSFPALTAEAALAFESLFPYLHIIALDYPLARSAAEIRKRHGLSLGDSVIAATAMHTRSTLVTRNIRDFRKVSDLKLLAI